MSDRRYQSWGRYPKTSQEVRRIRWRDDQLPFDGTSGATSLPFGNGRSYGDVCLNDGGVLLDCRPLDRFIRFDTETGVLRCEAGVLLSEVLSLAVPEGWFLPVTPGSQFVTIGGAIANDVHGKNHHSAGTFGRHVRCFELLRSDGQRLRCSPDSNEDFYKASIGGLGLTGVITWAEISLTSLKNVFIDREVIRYGNLAEFFDLAAESDQTHEHTVAWVDCLAKGEQLGRGLFIRGNHSEAADVRPRPYTARRLKFPVDPPFPLVNGLSLRLFNEIYYRRQRKDRVADVVHFRPFFYPLDAIYAWNRIYGNKGFFQYQCAIPSGEMREAIREILERIGRAGVGSFLSVLKILGDKPSPGLLSFPIPGATLALDFPNKGERTIRLLKELDEVTAAAGGRVYPAKDACLSARDFQRSYPAWSEMADYKDPNMSSSFWRRVTDEL